MRGLQTFEIMVMDDYSEFGCKRITRRGFIVGRFAVSRVGGGGYRIHHIPTGYYFYDTYSFRRAVVLAAILNELPDVTPYMWLLEGKYQKINEVGYEVIADQWKAAMKEYGFRIGGEF